MRFQKEKQLIIMFLCCETGPEKGKHVVQMFQSPQEQSGTEEKDIKLKAYIRANRPIINSKIINSTSTGEGGNDLDNIMNYLNTHHDDFQEFVLKRIMKSNYESLVDQYQTTNKMWVDPDFPPQQKSFGIGRNVEKVTWKRIREIVKNPRFIGSSISSSDILQGRIGDCYFLSAIAGLAQKDYRVKHIFPNLELNKNGIYMARVLHKGVLQEVVVDDYFPVSKKDGHLMGANPSGENEIWVMILEKCWAKLYGSYTAIDGGLPNEVLHAFSGAPVFQYITTEVTDEELDDIFNKMLDSSKLGHVICCGTNEDIDIEEMGLVLGHAYTVIQVFDRPMKLVKIRNPWGEREWLGNASDHDQKFWNKISSIDKKRLGYTKDDDGVFFMVWDDFVRYFLVVNICKIDDKANYYYEQLTYPRGKPVYTKLISKGGSSTFAITQEDTRGINIPAPRYATSVFLLARKINKMSVQDYEYVTSFTQRNVCDANQEVEDLQSGEYVIYSLLEGRNPKDEATLSCYCEKQVQITPLAQINSEEFLHRVFLDHARKNKENQQRIFGSMDVWVCMDIIYQSGFGYTVVHVGKGVKVKLGLTFNQDEYEQNNFQLLPPYKGSRTFKIVCQTGQDCIVLCKIVPKNYTVEASMPIPTIKRLL